MNKSFVVYRHAWRYNLAPDCEPELSDSQCKELLRQGGWMVRNTFDFDCKDKTDFWYVIKDSFGGMDELSKKDRKFVLKSLESLDFKIIDKQIIIDYGYEIVKKEYDSFVVKDRRINKKIFKENLKSWDEKNHEFWGIFDKQNGCLVGFSVVRVFDSGRFYDTLWILPEYKKNYHAYYGLCYNRNEYYLGEKKLKYVTDGSRSITEHSNIQPFLEQKFKFRKAYCNLKIRYKWWFGIIVRLLYPFRNIIPSRNIRAVLKMHGMQSK